MWWLVTGRSVGRTGEHPRVDAPRWRAIVHEPLGAVGPGVAAQVAVPVGPRRVRRRRGDAGILGGRRIVVDPADERRPVVLVTGRGEPGGGHGGGAARRRRRATDGDAAVVGVAVVEGREVDHHDDARGRRAAGHRIGSGWSGSGETETGRRAGGERAPHDHGKHDNQGMSVARAAAAPPLRGAARREDGAQHHDARQVGRAGLAAIPTMGAFSGLAPAEPRNPASPKLKMPPSEATSQ